MDGLAYNTSGHFTHCSYPHVLYAKPSNKVYVFLLSFAVVLPFTHVGVFLFAVIIYQWDQNMEQSFKNRVAAAAREYCAKAQCFPNQSRWMVFVYFCLPDTNELLNQSLDNNRILNNSIYV